MAIHGQDERAERADGHQVERDGQQWRIHWSDSAQVVARGDHHQNAQECIGANQYLNQG
ncbi:hypothetical protein I5Q33_21700, partial [Pseudomonas guariconensis]|nr:hypothetical protein [Pseudomonas guariconensis]